MKRHEKGSVSELNGLIQEICQPRIVDLLHMNDATQDIQHMLNAQSRDSFRPFFEAADLHEAGQLNLNLLSKFLKSDLKITQAVQELNMNEQVFFLLDLTNKFYGDSSISKADLNGAMEIVGPWCTHRGERHFKTDVGVVHHRNLVWEELVEAVGFLYTWLDDSRLQKWLSDYSDSPAFTITNMPSPSWLEEAGGFVGRNSDRKTIHKALRRSKNTGVEILGRGGLGKTALVQKIVQETRFDLFSHTAWFSAKTDEMTTQGVQGFSRVDKCIHDVLSSVAQVLHGLAREDLESYTLDELHQDVVKDVAEKNVLIVLDNWETLSELLGAEDYELFKRMIDDEESKYYLDAKWLITTRVQSGVNGLNRHPLDRLQEGDGHSYLLRLVKNANLSSPLRKALQKRGVRKRWLEFCFYYPLFLRMVVGWLGDGRRQNEVFNKTFPGLKELEEFCFRQSVSAIEDLDTRRLLACMVRCTQEDVQLNDVLPKELRIVLNMSVEDFEFNYQSLKRLCLVQDSTVSVDAVEVAPLLRKYIESQFKSLLEILTVDEVKGLKELKRGRTVIDRLCGASWGAGMRRLAEEAHVAWQRGKEDSQELELQIESMADGPFRRQLAVIHQLRTGESIGNALRDLGHDFHGGYYYFIQILIREVKRRQLDFDGSNILDFLVGVRDEFGEVVDYQCDLWVQQVYVHKSFDALRNVLLEIDKSFEFRNRGNWKRANQVVWEAASRQSLLADEMRSDWERFLLNLQGMDVWKGDELWADRVDSSAQRVSLDSWLEYLWYCAEQGSRNSRFWNMYANARDRKSV